IYTMKEGLSNNFIKSLVFDNYDNLWMATNNGVTRFNIETRKAKSYTIKDGLPSCSFYFNAKYKDESGKIYFGTTEGYLLVNTENIITNQVIPPIVITEFKVNNETIQPSLNNSILKRNINFEKEITLPYNYNSLTFEFAALNYNSSRNNNYAYYLEGFDKTWIMSGTQRTATYTNLDPGTYKFHVKGSNNDNIWNEQGRTIIIKIIPPFWDSWIFISLSIAFGILLIYGWYYWRVRSIRYKNMLLEEAVRQRTKELNETNEQLEAFVYKASHDIKGPLKSIIGLMTLGMQEFKDENVHNYFKHVLKTSKKLEKLLLDLLEITRVKQVELNLEIIDFREMIDSAIENFHNFPGFDKMQFHIDIDAAEPFYSDKKLLYPVIQNLVENPIKYADFTKDENLLHISITTSKSGAELIFKDNGIGIHQDYQDQIFNMFFKANENSSGSGLGLYIVKTTIEKLKGKIKLTSQPGVGSTFIVHFDRLRP
ncbi:MAG TPA: ATP-binding protein, partial [Cytophagaceae bacterium]